MSDPVIPLIKAIEPEMIKLRRMLHQHPELGFEEVETSKKVVQMLTELGFKVTTGLAKTGVVASMTKGHGGKTIGIRADMDALPVQEENEFSHRSCHSGVMHACGHDGHTAILLTAAHYIASAECQYNGTVHLIFQPSEEGNGGAIAMVEEGLFDRFPCDAIFGLHNMPNYPAGKLGFYPGAFMSSSDTVDLVVHGKGGHGAHPDLAIDPIVVAAQLVVALQTIVSRNVEPDKMAVVTVGSFNSGHVSNVIPETAKLQLTVRAMQPEVRQLLLQRIEQLAKSTCAAYGASCTLEVYEPYPVLVNSLEETEFARQVAVDWLGEAELIDNLKPSFGSEDFSSMMEVVPGCYLIVGNGSVADHGQAHNPTFDFNDESLAIAASYWGKLVERYLA